MSLFSSSAEGLPTANNVISVSSHIETPNILPSPLEPERIRAYITEIGLQIPKAREGLLKPSQIQSVVDEAIIQGVPRRDLVKLFIENGVTIVDKSKQLTEEKILELVEFAYRKTKSFDEEEQALLLDHRIDIETNLLIERSKLPDSIGMRFRAHGIAKGTTASQLRSLLNLLDGKFDRTKPLYTSDLKRSDENEISGAIGAAGPYDTGGFIIVGEPKKLHQPISETKDIPETGVRGVLVNREWYEAIAALQNAYPEVKFIRADEMEKSLIMWLEQVDNT